ncbi:MAG: DUF3018 family protein [Alphaproteobacteria bacterium]|nr:DUF3018 family protein [Alphaproteobacteria bacterium]
MPGSAAWRSSRTKVQAHRDRLRAQGLRPVQIWLPDVRSARFKREAERQSRLVARSRGEKAALAFIAAAADWGDEA